MVNSLGVLIWFDNTKGFGMLETPDNQLTFVHIKSFKSRPDILREKQVVVFTSKPDQKRQRAEAANSHLLTEAKDWQLVMQYLGKEDTVFLHDNHRGQPNQETKHKETGKNKQSLMRLSMLQLFKTMDEDAFLPMLTNYFDNRLDSGLFIEYCRFLEQNIIPIAGAEKGSSLLHTLFQHFGANLDAAILFSAWKNRKFGYIGYPDAGDYEIPENVLIDFADSITADELLRIREYACAAACFSYLIPEKLREVTKLTEAEIAILYENVDLLNPEEQLQYKPILEELYQQNA